MKEETTIEAGDSVLIDGALWADVEAVVTGPNGEQFLVCVDCYGEEHSVDPESVLRSEDL